MLTRMSDSADRTAFTEASSDGSGVLGGLPRTRPQRASARRAAARAARPAPKRSGTPTAPARKPAASTLRKAPAGKSRKRAPTSDGAPAGQPRKRAPTSGKASAGKPRKRTQTPAERPPQMQVPKQGYEAEPETTGPVQPPGGAELIASAAELAGELAKTGIGAGARALRDFLSRLPG
jgi:hypothetical protein